LLDVGCGNGQFVYWANKRGFIAEGVEVNERTAEYAKKQGLKVFTGFLEEAPLQKESYGVIFLGEIIEHVTNPRSMIQQCYSLLESGGMLIITTPNINCAWSRTTLKMFYIFGIPWSSVTPPYHLYQFNDHNLDMLVEGEGFAVEKEWYLRIPPLKYELGMLHVLKRYKKTRKFKDFVFMVFSYLVYTVLHTFFKVVHPLMEKDFQMVKVYKKRTI
jgi:SAM-dependent methyltransferase